MNRGNESGSIGSMKGNDVYNVEMNLLSLLATIFLLEKYVYDERRNL